MFTYKIIYLYVEINIFVFPIVGIDMMGHYTDYQTMLHTKEQGY